MSVFALWQELDRLDKTTTVESIVVRRIDPESSDSLFAGIRVQTGTHLLRLQLPNKPRLSRHGLVQSRGFKNYLTRFESDPAESCSLVIETADPSFNRIFAVLAEEIVVRLQSRTSQETSVGVFLGCLHDWKRFFDTAGTEGLSIQKLLGLFAEVTFLRDVGLRYVGNPVTAVSGWVGPDPLCKDFQFQRCAIEVKGTSGREPIRISVNGERQLDDEGHPALFLYCLIVEQSASGGMTIPELIDATRAVLVEPRARLLFEEKLLEYGYHDVHREHYAIRFIVHEHRIFRVRSGFPRLTPPIPPGVGDLSYSVTLSACAP